MTKVVVIGAGFSGLVSAITIKRNNSNIDVQILEKLSIPGKKILVTGNGRCNYFNDDQNLNHFHSSNNGFINNLDTSEVLEFYSSIGIIPCIKDGYYYPYYKEASSVKDALLNEINRLNIKITTDYNVYKVIKENDKFIINDDITCDKLIISTGSPCYYKDRDFTGYVLAENLGHKVIDVLPGLVQLVGEGNYFKKWQGVRSEAEVFLYIDNNLVKKEKGEVMLTEYGLSGICIFNLSSMASRALDLNKKVRVDINFLPFINDNYKEFFMTRKYPLKESLNSIINNKLVDLILDKCEIDGNRLFNELEDNEKDKLINNLKSFEVDITGTKDFDRAQIATGGVDTVDVNKDTMESNITKNLFFAGEVLDVDGDCGGYNIMFATLSGIKAGIGASND